MQPDDRNSISSKPTALPSRAVPPADVPPAAADTSRTLSSQETAGGAVSPSSAGALSLDIERKVFAERFDLLEELGSGGMGRVLKAFDRKLQRAVAVKRIKGPLATDPDLLRRFLREAQFAARLNHPNVVTVHDILTDDEGPYLVLEFIDGESLAQRLQRGGAIPWQEAIDLLLPICDAVAAAHAQGIIHRDIKPANILLPKKGPPKLADFGIARSLEGSDLTASGALLGTLDYMAPEQMDSAKTADARSDVYSLAATLYHMVTGEGPRPISVEDIPPEMRSLVVKGLNRYPERRQLDIHVFAVQLAETKRQLKDDGLISDESPEVRPPRTIVEAANKDLTTSVSAFDTNAVSINKGRLSKHERDAAIRAVALIRRLHGDAWIQWILIPFFLVIGAAATNAPNVVVSLFWVLGGGILVPIVLGVFGATRHLFVTRKVRAELYSLPLREMIADWDRYIKHGGVGDFNDRKLVDHIIHQISREDVTQSTWDWCSQFVSQRK